MFEPRGQICIYVHSWDGYVFDLYILFDKKIHLRSTFNILFLYFVRTYNVYIIERVGVVIVAYELSINTKYNIPILGHKVFFDYNYFSLTIHILEYKMYNMCIIKQITV